MNIADLQEPQATVEDSGSRISITLARDDLSKSLSRRSRLSPERASVFAASMPPAFIRFWSTSAQIKKMKDDMKAVGLDVGTSRIRCVIGEPAADGRMDIIGVGEADAKGLRRGVVTAAEMVAESIRRAVGEAERVAGSEVDSAVVNLSGEHFRGENKNGVVAVAGAGREISEEDVERAIESASAMPLPPGWEIIARLPKEFIIDGQDGITEPVGMTGAAAGVARPYRYGSERGHSKSDQGRQTCRNGCRAADA